MPAARIPTFAYPVERIKAALSVERLGGVYLFNFCANGETLLRPKICNIIEALLENGHYLEVVTNGTLTERLKEIAAFSEDNLTRLSFKFFFHYLELIRTNQLKAFADNVRMMKACGCSFTIEIVPCDELLPYVDEIKEFCLSEFGVLCHLTVIMDHANDLSLLSSM